ncbi:MAG: cytochrome c oxidase subunit II [Actinobacteria bacterium]|uniref:cytochrome-c oxidase n=1 Tax=freshwater metagenome TaxID=449393 RepID=A0A6J6PDJ2_9ZZZZ|nr:cytochrome c oxidase subunit II [Actinomycetota bacterium]
MRRKNAFRWAALPLAATLILVLSGCSSYEFSRGFLPGEPGVTNHTDMIVNFWNGSWIVLWAVGLIAWGLMFYAVIVYRRRKGDNTMPPQMRYNNPIEALFTVVPLVLVIGFFAFTADTMEKIERPVASDINIQVIGKQWSWDFNYLDNNVYETGIQSQFDGELGSEAALPTLYLPVNTSVKIELKSRDVVHSFWVIDFLYKKDTFPGKTNYMYFTPQREGTYKGKCAELCGEYHSMMLFNVKVVSRAEFDSQMAALAAKGNTGLLDDSYDRNQNLPGNGSGSKG